MNQGYCYMYVPAALTHIEAEMVCNYYDSILAKPESFTHAEFLEALVSIMNPHLNVTGSAKIWLGYRLEDLTDFSVFDDWLEGHQVTSAPDGTDSGGLCVAMVLDDSGNHLGWHRDTCQAQSYFICQRSKLQCQLYGTLISINIIFR